jgi:hypothetical protein
VQGGKQHDFSMFKESNVLIHPDTELLADSGYQDVNKYHENSVIPVKKKKGSPLPAEAKIHNKALSKRRILIENINRGKHCKLWFDMAIGCCSCQFEV